MCIFPEGLKGGVLEVIACHAVRIPCWEESIENTAGIAVCVLWYLFRISFWENMCMRMNSQ